MNQEYKICLLKDGAQATEAKEVSSSVLGHVYNFINLERFSHEIRYGVRDANLSHQLDEVVETRATVLKTIEGAIEQQKPVNLTLILKMEIPD